MSNDKPPPPKTDDLAKQLKASLAQRRPRTWKPVLTTLAVSTLLLAGLALWLYPRARTGPLHVIALDAIFTPDEMPLARAQLLAPTKEETPSRWSGHTIVFQAPPGDGPREAVVVSDQRGQASSDWPLGEMKSAEFFAKYINVADRHYSQPDRGRLFVWLKDAPLLIVDADEALIADALDEQAAVTLNKAAQEGWHIVYLALAGARAHDFRTARGWIENQAKLPKGPVLGRPYYPNDQTADQVRRDLLKNVHGRFEGPMLAVVMTTEAGRISKQSGLRTILIGAAELPAEVARVQSWADVPVRLK